MYPVEHLGPWVASTAASTHDGSFGNNNVTGFTGGDSTTLASVPSTITGEGITGPLALSDIVYAGDGSYDYSPYPGSFSTSNTYTLSGTNYADPAKFTNAVATAECLYPFPSGTFTGKIVVCDRGDIPLVDKADNVKQGGAAGIVIVSQSGNALLAESYEIPGTMIDNADGSSLKTWLTNATTLSDKGTASAAQAQTTGSNLTSDSSQADQIANFSSRGPTGSDFDNLVKPDIAAPGVSVLAAVSNPVYTSGMSGGANQPETYDFYDGTSMASPHDTGSAALLMQLHPDWTPSEVKSALMLTAVTGSLIDQCASLDTSNNCIAGTTVPSPQVRGAGRVNVDAASRTGLLLDIDGHDYQAANPATGGNLTALNLASFANDNCVINCQWARRVTSAQTNTTATYTVSVSGASTGLKITVSPSSFTIVPGGNQVLTVTADVTGVAYQQWAYAQIDITTTDNGDDGKSIPAMHLPLAVESQQPEPNMSVSPVNLTLSAVQGQSTSQTLTINNAGLADLNWEFNNGNSSATSIWGQQVDSSGNGFPSGFFTPDGHGVYSSDHFVMPVKGSITKLITDGFAQDGSGPVNLSTATAIDWYIYADSNGKPSGNPEDNKSDYLWHFSSTSSGAGVDTTNGTITLDLSAAGQPLVPLSAGTYWLVVSPTFNAKITDPNGAAWYWFKGISADGLNDAVLIDPSNAFGSGTNWQALGASLAFTVTGTLDCSNTLSGLTFSESKGVVKATSSADVTVSFNANGVNTGSYSSRLCVTGNDPIHSLINVPISVTVAAASTSGAGSGGGGGGLGLIAIFGLALAGLRRRQVH